MPAITICPILLSRESRCVAHVYQTRQAEEQKVQHPSLSVVVIPLFLFATEPAAAGDDEPRIVVGEVNPWTHLNLANDPESFQFAIVTDRTGSHRPGVFPDAVRKLNLLQPEFVMSVGDLIEGYTEDREVLDGEWDEFAGFVEALQMPFFYLPGNHDISNQVMADVWQARFGPSYYSFVYRDVLFVCLNTESPESTRLSEPQLHWLEDVLAAHTDVRWTLVFLHKPLWAYVNSETKGGLINNIAVWGANLSAIAGAACGKAVHFQSAVGNSFG